MNKLERYFYFILIAIFVGLWAKECKRKDCPETDSTSATGSVPGYVPIPVDTLETDAGGIFYQPDSAYEKRAKQQRQTGTRTSTATTAPAAASDYDVVDAQPPVNLPRPPGKGLRPRIKYYRNTLRLVDGSTPVGEVILKDTTEGTILGRSYTYTLYPRATAAAPKQKALLYAGPEIYTDFTPRISGAGIGIIRISKNRATALSIGGGIPTTKELPGFGRIGFYVKF